MKTPFLSGRQVYLRDFRRSDLDAMVDWINDQEVTRLLFTGGRPATREVLEEQWERDQRNLQEVTFGVCRIDGDAFVGTTGLYSINWMMHSAEFRVFLGDRDAWGRGIGTECTKLMVVYGFEKLNLNRIWLGVNQENTGGVRAYEKAGFTREGILRQEQFRNFRYYDVLRMAILRSEYERLRGDYV